MTRCVWRNVPGGSGEFRVDGVDVESSTTGTAAPGSGVDTAVGPSFLDAAAGSLPAGSCGRAAMSGKPASQKAKNFIIDVPVLVETVQMDRKASTGRKVV